MQSDRRLSSITVPLYKLVPIVTLSFAIHALFTEPYNFIHPGFLFLLGWTTTWYLLTFRWKSVRLRGSHLYVSSYFQKAHIPISDISRIEGSSWWGWQPQTVTISFKSETTFGREVVFVPAGGWMWAEAWAKSLEKELGIDDRRPHS
ncbi:MAG TPA: hypothetical protein VMZ26_04005 [Pyrinomonadaceae bacterium]|nr:hypothetical protein [Pyrinomonadaceae bacterium]